VADPSAASSGASAQAHLQWWAQIWAAQRARGLRSHLVVTEHGPEPYQIWGAGEMAKEGEEEGEGEERRSAALWEINSAVKALLQGKFAALEQGEGG
jgi:hypothetical protein